MPLTIINKHRNHETLYKNIEKYFIKSNLKENSFLILDEPMGLKSLISAYKLTIGNDNSYLVIHNLNKWRLSKNKLPANNIKNGIKDNIPAKTPIKKQ